MQPEHPPTVRIGHLVCPGRNPRPVSLTTIFDFDAKTIRRSVTCWIDGRILARWIDGRILSRTAVTSFGDDVTADLAGKLALDAQKRTDERWLYRPD